MRPSQIAVLVLLALVVLGQAAFWLWGRDDPILHGDRKSPRRESPESGAGLRASRDPYPAGKLPPGRRRPGFLPNASKPSRGPFRGVVVDEAGKPVAGADVRALFDTDADRKAVGALGPTATSDAAGRFQITLAEERRTVAVVARGPRGASVSQREILTAQDDATVVLRATCPLRVRVADAEERPLAGILVRARTMWGSTYPWDLDPKEDAEAEAVTDAEGRVVLETPGGSVVAFAAFPNGPLAAKGVADVPPEGADVRLTPSATGAFVGTIRDPDGRPLSGAHVELSADYLSQSVPWPLQFEATSDALGAFRIDGVPCARSGRARRDTADVTITAEDHPTLKFEAPAPAPGETRRIDAAFRRWQKASGVVFEPDGRPCPGARIFASKWKDGSASSAWFDGDTFVVAADAAGRFETERVPPDTLSLVGYVKRAGKEFQGAAALRAEGSAPIEIRLAATVPDQLAPPFEVRVFDAEGGRVQNAGVRAMWFDTDPRQVPLEEVDHETTNEKGTATLHGLPGSGEPVVFLVTPKGRPTFAAWFGADRAPKGVTVHVPSGSIEGTVVDPDGRPVEAALRANFNWRAADGRLVSQDLLQSRAEIRADKEGQFRFVGLGERGEYTITSADDRHVLVGPPRGHRAGETGVRLVALSSTAARAFMPVGRFVDAASGRRVDVPIASLRVTQVEGPEDFVETTFLPNHEESVLLRTSDALAPGVYRGTLHVIGYQPVPVDGLRVPDGDRAPLLEATLSNPAGLVEGRVRTSDGRPLPEGVRVEADGHSAPVNADGKYTLAVPREDNLIAIVGVAGDFVRAPTQRVHVRPPDAARADFVVEPAGAIHVRLPAGRLPQFRVVVTATPLGDGEPVTLELDAASIASKGTERSLGGLPAGRFRLTVAWDGEAWPEHAVEVKLGGAIVLDLRGP